MLRSAPPEPDEDDEGSHAPDFERGDERHMGQGRGDLLGQGVASFYGVGFQGKLTANGERFNKWQMTAAHRTLKFGTCLYVENLDNGRGVRVRVNDRGPYAGGRILDLSEGAARKLDMMKTGVARVKLYAC